MTGQNTSSWLGTLAALLAIVVNVLALVLDSVLDRRLDRFLRGTTSLKPEVIEEIRHIASDRVVQISCIATFGALMLSLWPLRVRVAVDELAIVGIVIGLFSAIMWSQVLMAEPGTLSGDEWRRIRGYRISRFNLYNVMCICVSTATLFATTPEFRCPF